MELQTKCCTLSYYSTMLPHALGTHPPLLIQRMHVSFSEHVREPIAWYDIV